MEALLDEFTDPGENGLNKMAEGKEHKFRGLYSHSKGNGNVCNDKLAPEPKPKSVTFSQRNVQNFAEASNLLDSQKKEIFIYYFHLIWGVARRGGP